MLRDFVLRTMDPFVNPVACRYRLWSAWSTLTIQVTTTATADIGAI